MQDTKNLKKKVALHYPALIKEARAAGDLHSEAYWTNELRNTQERINARAKNRRKNLKQQKK